MVVWLPWVQLFRSKKFRVLRPAALARLPGNNPPASATRSPYADDQRREQPQRNTQVCCIFSIMRVYFNLNESLAYKYFQISISNAILPMNRKYLNDNGNRYRTRNIPEEPSSGHPSRQTHPAGNTAKDRTIDHQLNFQHLIHQNWRQGIDIFSISNPGHRSVLQKK